MLLILKLFDNLRLKNSKFAMVKNSLSMKMHN
ncbi:Uncharacterised protein [Serratia liquefaciens]|jgi:hypothetical protein|nr:Uncharacterised protein [Serratia liquefaciens]CAI2417965.1 Uncharacterised protein [Serratia liquefaciens]